MAREVRNVAASVRARLHNVARANRASFERVLTRYALERLLFRLSVSPHKERFVLKGAMFHAAWLEDPFRTTRDLDLLAFGERETERIVTIFGEICAHAVEDDGLSFDAERIAAEPIRDDRRMPGRWSAAGGWRRRHDGEWLPCRGRSSRAHTHGVRLRVMRPEKPERLIPPRS